MKSLVRRVVGIDVSDQAPRQQLETLRVSRIVLRVVGEAQDIGTATRADQQPQPERPLKSPQPDRPDDSVFPSMADLEKRKVDSQEPAESDIQWVLSMWRSGSKYDACEYMLKSNFLYTDFVRLVRVLDDQEALEMGTILDELAPPMATGEERSSDLISAVAGDTPRPEPPGGPNTPEE